MKLQRSRSLNRAPRIQKKVFAISLSSLREFHPDCLAVACAGSEIFLLLGDNRTDDPQRFRVIRTFDAGSLGKIEESVEEFEAVWRFRALSCFKSILDKRPGGYASIGFLTSRDMPGCATHAPSPTSD